MKFNWTTIPRTPEQRVEDRVRMLEPLDRKRVKSGDCPHPKCTGVHSHSRPRSEWCPRTYDLDREWDNSMERTFYKSMWALRSGIDRKQAQSESLGGEPSDCDPWENPISGASHARLRRLKASWEAKGLMDVANENNPT
jgi:hypothetical protein